MKYRISPMSSTLPNRNTLQILSNPPYIRADSRVVPSQWGMSLQSNTISNWLGANVEWALMCRSSPLNYIRLHIRKKITLQVKRPFDYFSVITPGTSGRDNTVWFNHNISRSYWPQKEMKQAKWLRSHTAWPIFKQGQILLHHPPPKSLGRS